MRDDVLIKEVLDKCEALKSAGFWLPEPTIRPKAWLNNFDVSDQGLAAILLDKFNFYNSKLTDCLLIAAYHTIGDGLPKGPQAPKSDYLLRSLKSACYTLITGEEPNPTDSGYSFCRKARQILGVSEENILTPENAIQHAAAGNTIVFLDDFIGSGDQFLKTWRRLYGSESFETVQAKNNFTAIYLALISTDAGLGNIHNIAPKVAVCVTHVISSKSTLYGLEIFGSKMQILDSFLTKYSARLQPKEEYILNNPSYLKFGYKNLGLMVGFEHSIPDATLPIFWAPGSNWEPLIERV